MSKRLDDYLAGEATDYLEQLEELLTSPDPPDFDHLLRLATGVRGSTQMAGADSVARLASRVEEAARSVATSHAPWSDEVRLAMRGALADVRTLVGALGSWGPREEQRVRESLDTWQTSVAADYRDPRPAVPIDTLFYDDEGPHVVWAQTVRPSAVEEAVPIERLLLRGEAALREALGLRPALSAMARGDAVPERSPLDLVDELFDLLELGLSREDPEA